MYSISQFADQMELFVEKSMMKFTSNSQHKLIQSKYSRLIKLCRRCQTNICGQLSLLRFLEKKYETQQAIDECPSLYVSPALSNSYAFLYNTTLSDCRSSLPKTPDFEDIPTKIDSKLLTPQFHSSRLPIISPNQMIHYGDSISPPGSAPSPILTQYPSLSILKEIQLQTKALVDLNNEKLKLSYKMHQLNEIIRNYETARRSFTNFLSKLLTVRCILSCKSLTQYHPNLYTLDFYIGIPFGFSDPSIVERITSFQKSMSDSIKITMMNERNHFQAKYNLIVKKCFGDESSFQRISGGPKDENSSRCMDFIAHSPSFEQWIILMRRKLQYYFLGKKKCHHSSSSRVSSPHRTKKSQYMPILLLVIPEEEMEAMLSMTSIFPPSSYSVFASSLKPKLVHTVLSLLLSLILDIIEMKIHVYILSCPIKRNISEICVPLHQPLITQSKKGTNVIPLQLLPIVDFSTDRFPIDKSQNNSRIRIDQESCDPVVSGTVIDLPTLRSDSHFDRLCCQFLSYLSALHHKRVQAMNICHSLFVLDSSIRHYHEKKRKQPHSSSCPSDFSKKNYLKQKCSKKLKRFISIRRDRQKKDRGQRVKKNSTVKESMTPKQKTKKMSKHGKTRQIESGVDSEASPSIITSLTPDIILNSSILSPSKEFEPNHSKSGLRICHSSILHSPQVDLSGVSDSLLTHFSKEGVDYTISTKESTLSDSLHLFDRSSCMTMKESVNQMVSSISNNILSILPSSIYYSDDSLPVVLKETNQIVQMNSFISLFSNLVHSSQLSFETISDMLRPFAYLSWINIRMCRRRSYMILTKRHYKCIKQKLPSLSELKYLEPDDVFVFSPEQRSGNDRWLSSPF
ncbi:hypothetical protein ADUPG1_008087, partial [Aduncisulcus paluster]